MVHLDHFTLTSSDSGNPGSTSNDLARRQGNYLFQFLKTTYLSFEVLWIRKDFREAGSLEQNKALEEIILISIF